MPSNHDDSRVVDIDGIAPTVKENHGTVTAIAEPFIVASRGRNPENPSDRTVGAPTEQRLEPNFSGCSNTLTSVQKDNYVAEPIVYDDYNSRISADQDAINTLTCNCGASAERNGVKIIEPVIVEDFYQSREPRVYSDAAPTIRSERVGLKAADGEFEELVERIKWRIRKLTAKECWRLMNFSDKDVDRASAFVSNSSLYKQAGNSIVVACLIGLMSSLFIEDGYKADVWTKYALHFND
jgi:site-specific DNA-cytosine methylase